MDDYQDQVFSRGLSPGQKKERKAGFGAGSSESPGQDIVGKSRKKTKLKAKSTAVIEEVRDETEVKEKTAEKEEIEKEKIEEEKAKNKSRKFMGGI